MGLFSKFRKPSLQRFKDAQKDMYPIALGELRNGRKVSHWIWYIFPQLKGLGRSPMSMYYGLDGIDEVKAYYNDPILQDRLISVSEALLLQPKDADIRTIMGSDIDVLKLKSCMTVFYNVTNNPTFKEVLDRYFK